MKIFNGNIQKFNNNVIEDYIDPFSITNLKILVSGGRDIIQTQDTYNASLRNFTNLGDAKGRNHTQTQGLPRLEKSQGFKVGVAGGASSSVAFSPSPNSTSLSLFLHFKTTIIDLINQEILTIDLDNENGLQVALRVSIHVGSSLGDGKLRINITGIDNTINYINFTSSVSLVNNTEYTIAVVCTNVNIKLYINSILQETSNATQSLFRNELQHKMFYSPGPDDVIFASYLFTRSELSQTQIKQLETKILNLGYL